MEGNLSMLSGQKQKEPICAALADQSLLCLSTSNVVWAFCCWHASKQVVQYMNAAQPLSTLLLPHSICKRYGSLLLPGMIATVAELGGQVGSLCKGWGQELFDDDSYRRDLPWCPNSCQGPGGGVVSRFYPVTQLAIYSPVHLHSLYIHVDFIQWIR